MEEDVSQTPAGDQPEGVSAETATEEPDEEVEEPAAVESELPTLEEQVEPLPEEKPTLPEGHILYDSEGRQFKVLSLVSGGMLRQYTGETVEGEGIQPSPVIILQAVDPASQAQLDRICSMLRSVETPMLPVMRAGMQDEESDYLVLDAPDAGTLAEAMASGLPFPRLVNILSQLAAGLTAMHRSGWLHLGLRPDEIYLSRPVKLLGLEHVCRIGEKPGSTFYIPGYSAPELIQEQAPDVRADIYSVGALLYHGITGTPIGESGVEMLTWQPPEPVPGVPQILSRCLGERDSRYPDMQSLHADLLRLAKRMTPVIDYEIAAATTIGLEPTRTTNQDSYGYLAGGMESEEGPHAWAVVTVSDGMGGMAAGEVASQAAVEAVLEKAGGFFSTKRTISAGEQVQAASDWMKAANERAVSALEARRAKGGATMVIACLINRRLTIAHVGDSRLYLIREDDVRQLTQDHSLAQALVTQGQIHVHEIRSHPDRNMVTRSLGDRQPMPEHYIDTLKEVTGEETMELTASDVLLLCSDGLWEPVLENEMLESLKKHSPDLHKASGEMISLALERGAHDNVTVLLVRLDETAAPVKEE